MQTHQEQLLDGVAMTTSISCSAQEEYQISEESAEEELVLSVNQEDETFDHHQPIRGQPERTILTETIKTKTRSRSDRKPTFTPSKTNTKKTWQTLFSLDDRLFQTHFIGLLQSTHSMMQKLNQLIVTEQYGRLKAYERELMGVIAQVEFGLGQYEKQKRGMLQQIQLLRLDNDHLNRTINQLHTVIEDLEKEVSKYFERNALEKYIAIKDEEEAINVPFARTFSHSLEEMAMVKHIQEGQYSGFITFQQFSSFILDLKKESSSILNCLPHQYLSSNPLSYSFGEDSLVGQWLNEIFANFSFASQVIAKVKAVFPNKPSIQRRTKLVQTFLNKLSRNRDRFLITISTQTDKSLYLWQVIHTSLITFFGIFIAQTHQCPLEISFGDSTRTWCKIFLDQIKILIEESHIKLTQDENSYLDGIERFVGSVHDLVLFRMLRND